ncbi:hypothetical protein GCM10027022_09090 [Alpinimonas psychrophila]
MHGGPPRTSYIAPVRALEHEAKALLAAAIFLGVGLLVGGLTMWGGVWPLFGANSVGQVAAAVGAISAILSFPAAYVPSISGEDGWHRRHTPHLSRTKRAFDTFGLAVCHGAIILLAILTIFTLMQSVFGDVKFDVLAGSICVGVASSISAYFSYLSGANVSSTSLANVFVVFLVSGGVASMLAATDSRWFDMNLSALGITDGFAGFTFNVTVALSGVIIIVLADYLVNDVDTVFKRRPHYRPWRTRVIRWSFLGLGVSLVIVGLIPVNQSLIVHNIAANALTIIFLFLLVFNRLIVPGFPAMFYIADWILVASLAVAAVLYYPVQYFNLTSYEMLTGSLIFCWIVIFVRNSSAALADGDDVARVPVAPPKRSIPLTP